MSLKDSVKITNSDITDHILLQEPSDLDYLLARSAQPLKSKQAQNAHDSKFSEHITLT